MVNSLIPNSRLWQKNQLRENSLCMPPRVSQQKLITVNDGRNFVPIYHTVPQKKIPYVVLVEKNRSTA
jgi:hypothetical protein